MARTTSVPAGEAGPPRPAGATLRRRVLGAVSALAVGLVGIGITATAPAAVAADLPTVATDALPTVQVDGVVWDTAVVGDTVYVAGSFTSARPAGSAAGVDETPRGNLLAFDIRTGALITSWAPTVNAPAYAITASPDGSLLYVGGDFTAATSSGSTTSVARSRIASFSASTGVLDTRVRPTPNAAVRAIVATADTVYLGGNFTTVGGVRKPRVAAVSASTGALTDFFASVQSAQVDALLLTPDGSKLVLGGRFEHISNVPALGVGWVNATTGSVVPFPANQVIQNSGKATGYSSGISSLSLAGDLVIGSGWHRLDNGDGSVGNLEGTFAASATTGELVWVQDCRGDTYSTYPAADGHIYLAGHPHECSAAGAFPEVGTFAERVHHYGLALTRDARLTTGLGTGTHHAGRPSPAVANWFPTFTSGTVTGQNQAGWTVDGNADYVVYGGEFPRVNGTAQAGLVRFAARPAATAKRGPVLTGASTTPSAVSRAAGTVQVSWPVNHDPDDGTLTYRVIRNGNTSSPVATVVHESRYWDRSRLSATDTGLANGTSYSYTVQAVDSAGNTVTSPSVSVTTATSGTLSEYARTVLADAPANFWRLGEAPGTVATWTGANPGSSTGVTSVTGAIANESNAALRFAGTSASTAASGTAESATNALSVEAWISTTTTRGGKIVGFGNARTGTSTVADRQIVMGDDGRLSFGVSPKTLRVVTSAEAYNDGRWHHVVATLGTSGMRLYVDGALVASDASVSTGHQPYTGFWRVGGDTLAGWIPGVTSEYFAGTVDEVATYNRALSAADVGRHYATGSATAAPQPPTASFTAEPTELTVAVDASESTDPDGTIASYAWEFGDGGTATGRTASRTYAAAGTYTVALTVTDDTGLTARTTRSVTVSAPVTGTLGKDSFTRTVASSWGTADAGGPWTSSASGTSVSGGAGLLTLAKASSAASARLDGASGTDVTTQVSVALDKVPNGAGAYGLVRARIVPSSDAYRLKLQYLSNGQVKAWWTKSVNGAETTISSFNTVAGLTYGPGAKIEHKTVVTGTNPTRLQSKVWLSGQAEPAAWLHDFTDSSASLQAAGHVGVWNQLSSTTTNGPVVVRYDDLLVSGPGGSTAEPAPAPAPQPPTASFTSQATDLTVRVDGSGSSDPDGTIASYAWTWGDGSTATGATASRTYAAAGSYPVTLTVTDDSGQTASSTRTVTVTAPATTPAPTGVLGQDAFGRTLSAGFGSADTGGAYVSSSSGTSVGGGAGLFTLAKAGSAASVRLPGASGTDVTTQVSVALDKVPNGSGAYGLVRARIVPSSDAYRLKLQYLSNGQVKAWWTKSVNGAETTISSFNTVAGVTYGPGTKIMHKTVATGTNPTRLRSKVWLSTQAEPAAWLHDFTDSSASLQAAGHVGLWNQLSSSTTNGPVVVRYDDLLVSGPGGTTAQATPQEPAPEPAPAPVTEPAAEPAAAGVVGQDAFGRTVGAGFGSADVGGTYVWSASGTSVSGGAGLFTLAKANSAASVRLPGAAGTDLTTQVTMALDGVPNGSGLYSLVRGRITASDDAYRLKLQHLSNGQVKLWWTTSVAGTESVISTYRTSPVTYGPGTELVVKTVVTGTSPTRLQSRIWVAGTAEPGTWLHDFTDSSASLQTSGHVGLWSMLAWNSTNGPLVVRYDDLVVTAAG